MIPPTSAAPYVAALAGLPGMGPATLVAVLARYEPAEAWAEIRAGRLTRPDHSPARAATMFDHPAPAAAGSDGGPPPRSGLDQPPLGAPAGPSRRPARPWAVVAARIDPPAWWAPAAARGIGVTWPGRPDYPAALGSDPQKPGALFYAGDPAALDRPCVAIVGTRSATPDGRAVAFAMGRDLAGAGVCVVSGLALGIDGAAHAGAVAAREGGAAAGTVGVAASGVDVAYPRRHAALWSRVIAAGAILSENLPGRPAQAWRFPTRNRVIAGLVAMVVVVESHARGGSVITAEAALARGVEVRVVPGPVRSPASEGSNQLLYEGAGPVRGAQDVLDALGVVRPAPGAAVSPRAGAPAGRPEERVLATLSGRPAPLEAIMARTGLGPAAVMAALDRLLREGLVADHGGYWGPAS